MVEIIQTVLTDKSKLIVKHNSSIYFIPIDEIHFIEKQGKKCLIHLKDKTYEITGTISELYKTLDDTFYLSHRSYIINLKKISHITSSNETFLAYFGEINKHAHISRLKIKKVEKIIQYI